MRKLLLVGLLLLLTGCARFVTDKTIVDPATGERISPITQEVEFTFTFRGTPAAQSAYKYYVVISTQNYRAVNPAYPSKLYFFVPGEQKDNQSINDAYYAGDQNKDLTDLYRDYFVSWNAFITYDSTGVLRSYTGPFNVTTANFENDHAGYASTGVVMNNALLTGTNNQLKFKMPLPYDSFYFNIFAVNNIDLAHKNLLDHIGTNIQYNYQNNGSLEEVKASDLSIDPGLDLINYKVRGYEY